MVELQEDSSLATAVNTPPQGILSRILARRSARLAIQVIVDTLVLTFSYAAAYWLRLDSIRDEGYLPILAQSLPLVLVISIAMFKFGGIYRQIWHLAHVQSALTIVKCVVAASMAAWVACLIVNIFPPIPRSVFPIFSMVAIILVGTSRFTYRHISGRKSRSAATQVSRESCIIYGAGVAGDLLARHIAQNPRFPFKPVGFIDDDANKRGRLVHGLRVLGAGRDLGEICKNFDVKTILIAMHSVSGTLVREIVGRCHEYGVKPLIMPELASSLGEEVFRPRSVDIRDLLRRSPKLIEKDVIRSFFDGETVFVSGAGGSIGSEICRQVLEFNPARLVMFDSSEFNLYKIEAELEERAPHGNTQRHYILGSVTDAGLIDRVFDTHRPTIVLHAAAYKHVPIIESNPIQGVSNNVDGTRIVAEAAVRYKTARFLLISTDKAVRPTSIMGATKRCCELVVQAMHSAHRDSTGFCAVRFGNVLGSSGSVVPRFMQQIQAGGPVTVTHPDVTRYFMLVSEAVALVLQAISMSKGGEIFVLDMGEPVKIYDMAKQLIRLAGKEPGRDIDIAVTGLRPGEKLYEELILETSECKQLFGDLYIAVPEPIDSAHVLREVSDLLSLAREGREESCIRMLRQITRWPEQQLKRENHDLGDSGPFELH